MFRPAAPLRYIARMELYTRIYLHNATRLQQYMTWNGKIQRRDAVSPLGSAEHTPI